MIAIVVLSATSLLVIAAEWIGRAHLKRECQSRQARAPGTDYIQAKIAAQTADQEFVLAVICRAVLLVLVLASLAVAAYSLLAG
jgi:hypothetical protein